MGTAAHAYRRGRFQIAVADDRRRARADPRPVGAVLAGTGDDNFGDEWMGEALAAGLPSCRLTDVTYPATERRLGRLGLSGAPLFAGVVISGGTLINPYFLPRALGVLGDGLPAWTVGTGAGSAGFGVPEDSADPDGWVECLTRFERVTVRGPRSSARLAAAGFGHASAVGDLALAHVPDEPLRQSGSRRVLVNVSGTELEGVRGEGMAEEVVLESIGRAVRDLTGAGWAPVPLVLHRDDLPRLIVVGRIAGGWAGAPVVPRSAREAGAEMTRAGALVGMRLHAAALGWIHGVPTLGLAYRDKTLDFAEQVGAGNQVADLRTAAPAQLESAVQALVARPREQAVAVHARAITCRDALRSLLSSIDAQISGG
ncbi:MAG: hypothetical protein QOE11_3653 [Solirubrobacteraceae bacterium]|nr:hypothetical protein [Solirubrobacteraceae bacterium]